MISREPATLFAVQSYLESSPYKLTGALSTVAALQRAHTSDAPDLILLDLPDTGADASHALSEIRTAYPAAALMVVSSRHDTRAQVEAIRLGAGYLTKPLEQAELQLAVHRHLMLEVASSRPTQQPVAIEGLGTDQSFLVAGLAMRKVKVESELLADINAPVLIVGESGTGKELTARLIHKLSLRANRRFLKVNCAALPADLLESELFGYERGAFTGALRNKPGQFELCDKGTILLDEIGEMPAALQAKLLHVLQDKQFFRLGGETTINVDMRVLAATNVNIAEALAARKLREDLYYRLSVFTIYLPPLRERREEIPFLLQHFMDCLSRDFQRPQQPISPTLLDACMRHDWPGNLRELENLVKRYLVLGDEQAAIEGLRVPRSSTELVREAAPETERGVEPVANGGNGDTHVSQNLKSVLRTLKAETEISIIKAALEHTHWNRKHAARLLNISYRGLLNKIRHHDLKPPVEAVRIGPIAYSSLKKATSSLS